MKLYIKQKVFSLNEKFTVKSENGHDIYKVEGSFLSIPKKFTVSNETGAFVATIQKKMFTFLPKLVITVNGMGEFEIVRNFTIFSQKYTVEKSGWTVIGDFLAHDYNIVSGRNIIAHISKKWLTWGDTYEIDVPNDSDALLALCVVICIDFCNAQDSAAASAAVSQ